MNPVVYWFHDVDQYDDRVRILYSTTPSLQQGQADPEGWRTNVYVVEARADGSVDQRRIFSRNEDTAALLLKRGHDQVFALRAPERKGQPQKMELWSTRDGSVSSSEPALHLPGTRGAGSTDLTQGAPTDGGIGLSVQLSLFRGRRERLGIRTFRSAAIGEDTPLAGTGRKFIQGSLKESFRILWLASAATLCGVAANSQVLLVHLR